MTFKIVAIVDRKRREPTFFNMFVCVFNSFFLLILKIGYGRHTYVSKNACFVRLMHLKLV